MRPRRIPTDKSTTIAQLCNFRETRWNLRWLKISSLIEREFVKIKAIIGLKAFSIFWNSNNKPFLHRIYKRIGHTEPIYNGKISCDYIRLKLNILKLLRSCNRDIPNPFQFSKLKKLANAKAVYNLKNWVSDSNLLDGSWPWKSKP